MAISDVVTELNERERNIRASLTPDEIKRRDYMFFVQAPRIALESVNDARIRNLSEHDLEKGLKGFYKKYAPLGRKITDILMGKGPEEFAEEYRGMLIQETEKKQAA